MSVKCFVEFSQFTQWRAQRIAKINSLDYKSSCKLAILGVGSGEDHIMLWLLPQIYGIKICTWCISEMQNQVHDLRHRIAGSIDYYHAETAKYIFQRTTEISSSLPVKFYCFSLVPLYPSLEQILIKAATHKLAAF